MPKAEIHVATISSPIDLSNSEDAIILDWCFKRLSYSIATTIQLPR
jgi:hypothetical protein